MRYFRLFVGFIIILLFAWAAEAKQTTLEATLPEEAQEVDGSKDMILHAITGDWKFKGNDCWVYVPPGKDMYMLLCPIPTGGNPPAVEIPPYEPPKPSYEQPPTPQESPETQPESGVTK